MAKKEELIRKVSETPLAENIKGRILEYLYTVNNKALN